MINADFRSMFEWPSPTIRLGGKVDRANAKTEGR
jgi:hypothetical protein